MVARFAVSKFTPGQARKSLAIVGWVVRYLLKKVIKLVSLVVQMPDGTAAGTILWLYFSLVLFNGAGPAANITTIGQQITQPKGNIKPIAKTKVKWG